jgi:hypothetical protein
MADNKTQHTPLQWSEVYFKALQKRHIRYYADGISETIAVLDCGDFDTDKANAEFIVKACNSHDELVKTLKEIKDIADSGLTIDHAQTQVISAKCWLAIQNVLTYE